MRTLREYIEHVYLKRFGKPAPDDVMSIEERLRFARKRRSPACIQATALNRGYMRRYANARLSRHNGKVLAGIRG